jgi:hypothetical protein
MVEVMTIVHIMHFVCAGAAHLWVNICLICIHLLCNHIKSGALLEVVSMIYNHAFSLSQCILLGSWIFKATLYKFKTLLFIYVMMFERSFKSYCIACFDKYYPFMCWHVTLKTLLK